jgi:cytoskeletal protein RodZ
MELTAGTMSFGEELKRERELREISLREVSEATKISLRYLEALERNDFKNLPGGVFNRGFVRAYSQFIGIDPDSMVDAYMQAETAVLGPAGSAPRGSGDDAGGAGRNVWIAVVAAVLIAAAVLYLGWTYYQARTTPAPPTAPAASGPTETGP